MCSDRQKCSQEHGDDLNDTRACILPCAGLFAHLQPCFRLPKHRLPEGKCLPSLEWKKHGKSALKPDAYHVKPELCHAKAERSLLRKKRLDRRQRKMLCFHYPDETFQPLFIPSYETFQRHSAVSSLIEVLVRCRTRLHIEKQRSAVQ